MAEEPEPEGWLAPRRETIRSRLALVRLLRVASPALVGASVLAALVAGLLPVGLIVAGGVLSGRGASRTRSAGTPPTPTGTAST